MASKDKLSSARVLIVDDRADLRRDVRILIQESYEVFEAGNAGDALREMESSPPDVVLLDLNLGRGYEEGLALLAGIRKRDPDLPVIILSSHRETDTIVQAMRLGASQYLEKTPRFDLLLESLRVAVDERMRSFEREAQRRREGLEIVGSSPGMAKVLDLAQKAAEHCDVDCLIRGETGSGKGLVAKNIHRWSARKDGPWVDINIASLSPTLLEAELFGHVKGAFTDAFEEKRGFFELGSHGTLFLDEIGDLLPALQVRLLKVLDERSFYPVGSRTPVTTQAHILAATHEDLEAMVAAKSFRADLYHRLTGFVIQIPPLRARIEDVAELARVFLGPAMRLTDEALAALQRHPWPGNVRELGHVLKRASMLATDGVIDVEHIEFLPLSNRLGDGTDLMNLPYHQAMESVTEAFQRTYLGNVLRRCKGVVARASRESGIARGHLHTLINKLGLEGLTAGGVRPEDGAGD